MQSAEVLFTNLNLKKQAPNSCLGPQNGKLVHVSPRWEFETVNFYLEQFDQVRAWTVCDGSTGLLKPILLCIEIHYFQ